MKRFNKIAVCLAGGLALNAGLRADTVPLTGNPYALVVARNIFGLNPPAPVDPNPPPVEPPVKITPNGIMNVFGKLQVFFKVSGKAPGKEDSYALTEGQGQDDIEVVKIDEKNGVVTFNNHGVEQVLPLAAAPTSSTPAPVAAAAGGNSGIPGIPGVPSAGTFGSSGFNTAFGGRGATTTGVSTPAAGNGTNLRDVPTRNNTFIQQPQTGMSELEQTAIIELNRAATQPQVDRGELPPLPPTEGTPDGATSIGGRPLVTPPPSVPPQ